MRPVLTSMEATCVVASLASWEMVSTVQVSLLLYYCMSNYHSLTIIFPFCKISMSVMVSTRTTAAHTPIALTPSEVMTVPVQMVTLEVAFLVMVRVQFLNAVFTCVILTFTYLSVFLEI